VWERLCDQQKAVVIETITGILTKAASAQDPKEKADERLRLVERAGELGWLRDPVIVVDADLGLSGAGFTHRSGFARRLTEVVLGQVGIIRGLEVSRRARNHADWRGRLDFCGMTDTLTGDGDGLYHPGLFNDGLVLGLKGTLSEAELHMIRARLEGGIRNKAARGANCGAVFRPAWCGESQTARRSCIPIKR